MSLPEKKVAIVQSNYIPWKGYFDLIRASDIFVLYEDAQYTQRDWRNRNRIKTADGLLWLTIPVEMKGNRRQAIKDVRVLKNGWEKKHWDSIRHAYAKTPYFKAYKDYFEGVYRDNRVSYLSEINRRLIEGVFQIFSIRTKLVSSVDYSFQASSDPSEKLLRLCQALQASDYISGPLAKAYLNEELFQSAQIRVRYVSYDGYPEYRQLHPPFVHEVSVLDLIFNEGPNAINCLRTL